MMKFFKWWAKAKFEDMVLASLGILVVSLMAIPIVCVGCQFAGGAMPNYSDGERTGTVFKLSRKGIFYKSWEGTLNAGGVSDDGNGIVTPNTWEFSARDADIIRAIQEAQASGRRITLIYRQWLIHPIDIDTSYEAVSVK